MLPVVLVLAGLLPVLSLWMEKGETSHEKPTLQSRLAPGQAPAPPANPDSRFGPAPGGSPIQTLRMLAALETCEGKAACPEAGSDPYAAEYERNRKMAALLRSLTKETGETPEAREALRKVAAKYLSWPDGHVQSAALDILSGLPPNPENVRIIVMALDQTFDAPLMRQAMDELGRYPDREAQMRPFLSDLLLRGSIPVSQEVARDLLPLLNDQNATDYAELQASLDPESAKAEILAGVLKEFHMRSQGG